MGRNLIRVTTLAFGVYASVAFAGEDHDHHNGEAYASNQHEAHVHGVAELTVAKDGTLLEMGFQSPGMNLVGFEHKAHSPSELEAVADTEKKLKDVNFLFEFQNQDCHLSSVNVDISPLLDEKSKNSGQAHKYNFD